MFNLNIHNYRSFQNQNLKFSRINILIGENSGGKSSLLKFLLALKQTIDSPVKLILNSKEIIQIWVTMKKLFIIKLKQKKLNLVLKVKKNIINILRIQ